MMNDQHMVWKQLYFFILFRMLTSASQWFERESQFTIWNTVVVVQG